MEEGFSESFIQKSKKLTKNRLVIENGGNIVFLKKLCNKN